MLSSSRSAEFINFSKVSKTEQRGTFERPHAGPIAGRPRYPSATESYFTLPPRDRRAACFNEAKPNPR
jgi:hypothetical protein